MPLTDYEVKFQALVVCVRTARPVCLWGDPGIGKTATVELLGNQLFGKDPVTFIGSICEPSDLLGLPLKGADDTVYYGTFEWAKRLTEQDILFLDEFTTCPPAIQAGMMKITLKHEVGFYKLPTKLPIVLAANDPDDVSGSDMLLPMRNRVTHIQWVPDKDFLMRKASDNYVQPPHLPNKWHDRVGFYEALVSGFLQRRPELRNKKPHLGSNDDDTSQAWPSSRSWEAAAMLMAASEHLEQRVIHELVTGTVGVGPALEFLKWQGEVDLPNPEDLLKDPKAFELPVRSDIQYAILQSVLSAVASDFTDTRYKNGWQIISKAADKAIDIAAIVGREMVRIGQTNNTSFTPDISAFRRLSEHMRGIR